MSFVNRQLESRVGPNWKVFSIHKVLMMVERRSGTAWFCTDACNAGAGTDLTNHYVNRRHTLIYDWLADIATIKPFLP